MKRIGIIISLLTFLTNSILLCQVHEDKRWCVLNCDPNIHIENTDLIYKSIHDDAVKDQLKSFKEKAFPLRFVHIGTQPLASKEEMKKNLDQVVLGLNQSFSVARFKFYIEEIEFLESSLALEDLSRNEFNKYDEFSKENDKPNIITVYILNPQDAFCKVTDVSISCSKIGGFSYILSNRTSNIVLSSFDLRDIKIVTHEFGHFFGLYHTFEKHLFGEDNFETNDCYTVGDRICDTPPDPGAIFEAHVNYTACEMFGYKNMKGKEYKPLVENYMSYYKPCYLKEYSFSDEQVMVMQLASGLEIRNKFSRK